MAEQYRPNVGHEPAVDAYRDAIHIAVAPVVAGEQLMPGQPVSLTKDKYRHATLLNPRDRVGIVDPFLTEPVVVGQRFWLFLYPNTITNLRHVWSHPAFKAQVPEVDNV